MVTVQKLRRNESLDIEEIEKEKKEKGKGRDVMGFSPAVPAGDPPRYEKCWK
jgi:predicted transcriptional regulator